MSKKIISPFRGLHYNPLKIKNFAEVMAPPYDVIDEAYREKLYARHPQNVVKLILTQEEDGKILGLNKYEMAAKYLQDWQKQELLVQDAQPQLYLYHQTYTLADGRALTRKGFIARRRLEPFDEGKIRPHEYTFAGPKADRLQLIKSTQTNLSAIFGIFSDAQRQVMKNFDKALTQKPLMDLVTDDGNRHQVWAVGDLQIHEQVNTLMQDKITFIADGHHRYETALNYRDYCLQNVPSSQSDPAYNFVMMYLCPMEDEGLVILPTHRVLDVAVPLNLEAALQKLSQNFEIKKFAKANKAAALQELQQVGANKLGFILSSKEALNLIQISFEKLAKISALASLSAPVRELDVTVLHHYLLPEIFEINLHEGDEVKKIHYVKDTQEALEAPEKGQASLSFILNPTQMKQVEAISNIGERMPHKSTFFYPKLLSGLVFNPLD
ncbi:MAG: DUF1015 domain-containing protein [Deltaproteobacteria bacterium]|nr:DUF1015 domain-containing protein [Deltaproteobacteria bacterium]